MAGLEVEDDESWLYGDDKKDEATPDKAAAASPEKVKIKEEPKEDDGKPAAENGEDKEAGEVSGDDEKEEGEGDSDDSEDDIQVTIGDIKAQSYDKFKGGYQRAGQGHKGPSKGLDVDTPGSINGVPVVEYDVSGLQPEEKPWQKPGADITDYFNYGFNEETWIKYCNKQAVMRGESGSSKFVPGSGLNRTTTHNKENDSSISSGSNTNYNTGPVQSNWRSAPTHGMGRKTSGTIEMIGTTTRDSRRNVIRDYDTPPPSDLDMRDHLTPTSGAPITTMGPPPVNMPPPNFGVPPPGMPPGGLPPTNMPPPNMSMPPPGTAPPGFPPPQPFYGGPPPTGAPPGAPPYVQNYSGPPPGYGAPPPSGPPDWDNRGSNYGNNSTSSWGANYGGGNNQGSDSELSSSDDERGPGYSRGGNRGEMYDPFERERSESRSRDYRGSRDRDHDRDRERRHRDRGDREERHKRRKHDDDERRSKHRKSKRSKRDRDEEDAGSAGEAQ